MSLVDHKHPFELFEKWFGDAKCREADVPEAMSLSSVSPDGKPSSRMVLLKGVDERGFVFYTNCTSRKGQQIQGNSHVALLFHWKSLKRQVRIEGQAVPVTEAEADAYFASRHKDSRIGAWASKQSQPMEGRFEFEKRIAKYAAKYTLGDVPRPEFWSGFRIKPTMIEFWQDRSFRLHERNVYSLQDDGQWEVSTLYP
ncbi:pyridoxamine 5'-phosphate oxidase [Temperatibacter marinus]|uniref:Pyridoxine/pyridoxamine 5'-phosphate oxidase n=1 Tax=Temperatibacter marinus TaxID=1456591 RepID=A0AA52EH32_9PROT|nr:pyridoxamine 5'-phosphate oxidase [Temperatibacter marinus]WND01946.1 pyridoxamine 5'-phosphate oxidase [Temperatibacter marinus]